MGATHLGGGLELPAALRGRVAELAERLERYRDAYYRGQPLVSDAAYDELEDELRRLAPAHPVLAAVGSPVVAEAWEKAPHQIAMGSLNKVVSREELGEWIARCDELLGPRARPSSGADLFVTEKLDGLSIELCYRDGRFVDAITRGDGEIGERITSNVARMRGVPRRIAHEGALSLRGEIILRLSDRARHFPDYTSPRNAAAGTSRRLDGQGTEHLTVLCYDVADELELATEEKKLALLQRLGFATPNGFRGDVAAVLACYEEYAGKRRAELDYEIDGLVVRVNRVATEIALGELNRRPRGAVAFKFPSPVKVTRVTAIRWDTGPSGRVTPVAIVEPVELVGATVRRASLHNVATVRRLGIGVGDEVLVSRRNDVIPYVEEVVASAGAEVVPPGTCGVCGAELVLAGEYLLCRNARCRALIEGRLRHWLDAIGVLEWGDKLVSLLVESGKVGEPLDLYRLGPQDIASLERHGDKSAKNALAELHRRLPLPLPVFLAALGIEGFALQTARLVVGAGYGDLDALLAATPDDLARIAGIGAIKAQAIVAGLAARKDEIARLCAGGIAPVSGEAAGPLAGKSFCITGTHRRSRAELTALIEDHGGRVVGAVSQSVDFLLIADPASSSSKAEKARRYGTALLDEAGLERLIARRA